MKPRLYDMTSQYAELLDGIIDSSVDGEVLPELADALDALTDDIKTKCNGCCAILSQLEHDAAAHDAEAERLKKRSAAFMANHKRLKDYLQACLERAEIPKLNTGLFSLSICNNSAPSVNVVDIASVPHEFDKVQEREVSRSAIAAAVANGREVPGVEVIRGRHLRIR